MPVKIGCVQSYGTVQDGVSYTMCVYVRAYPGRAHHYLCAYQLYSEARARVAFVCPTLVLESTLVDIRMGMATGVIDRARYS